MPEFMTLARVSETMDCPVREIGRTLGYTKSVPTRDGRSSGEKGPRITSPVETDGRICCVKITKKGANSLKTAFTVFKRTTDALLSRMPDDFRKARH